MMKIWWILIRTVKRRNSIHWLWREILVQSFRFNKGTVLSLNEKWKEDSIAAGVIFFLKTYNFLSIFNIINFHVITWATMSNLRELLEIHYEYPVEGVSNFFFLFVSLFFYLIFFSWFMLIMFFLFLLFQYIMVDNHCAATITKRSGGSSNSSDKFNINYKL